MTDDRPPLNPNRHSSSNAGEYLDQYGPGRAVTKAEHDRRVAETGRPFTESGGIKSHKTRSSVAKIHTHIGDEEAQVGGTGLMERKV